MPMTKDELSAFVEDANRKQLEYERRRAVWRWANNLPGRQEPPCETDAQWLLGGTTVRGG